MKYTIKELRARNNFTQEELAKRSGLNARTVNSYESNVEKLAEVLKVQVDDIFLG